MKVSRVLGVLAVSMWVVGCLPAGSIESRNNGEDVIVIDDGSGGSGGGSEGGGDEGGGEEGGGSEGGGNEGGGEEGGEEGGDEGGDEGGGGEPGCAANELDCAGTCQDVSSNTDHCGTCGNACGAGGQCDGGACACAQAGLEWCGVGDCVDLSSSKDDCGQCGRSCSGSEQCVEGSCVDLSTVEQVLLLTNQARAQARDCGGRAYEAVGPLEAHPSLAQAAQAHAQDMAMNGYFAHDSQDGTTATQRMRMAGYTGGRTGENIAAGQPTPEAVVNGWLDSPGHCRNIMNGGYRHLGVGYVQGGSYRHYWVQNFGG